MRHIAQRFFGFLSALALVWGSPAAASLRVNPLIVNMSPDGRNSSAIVQLTNVTDIALPFEVTVVKRTIVDGREVEVSAEDDFVIFPPQMIIQPAETQTLRMQWIVGQARPTSESYYVYVTQVPVEVQQGVTGIRISYRFGVSVHVVPPNVQPDLEVVALRAATNASGARGFEIDVHNAGSRFARLSEHEMSLDGSHSWDREALKTAVGIGFLLPGQRSTFFVAYDGAISASSTAVLAHRGPA